MATRPRSASKTMAPKRMRVARASDDHGQTSVTEAAAALARADAAQWAQAHPRAPVPVLGVAAEALGVSPETARQLASMPVTGEDSSSAPLPDGYPYRVRLRRKEYEAEKQTVRRPRRRRQGRHHQALHGTSEPARRARRGPGEADRARTRPVVLPALHQHLPAAGEIVLFDRSWYNRAGVERVMGFCNPANIWNSCARRRNSNACWCARGIRLFKFWFSSRARNSCAASRRANRSAEAVEAVADRPRLARQVGRLHRGQGGDVLLHRHRRRALDHRQVRRQEARPPELHAALPGNVAAARRGRRGRRSARARTGRCPRLRRRTAARHSAARSRARHRPLSARVPGSGGRPAAPRVAPAPVSAVAG
jgi:hypothetical protein